jgi:hypothetical protein
MRVSTVDKAPRPAGGQLVYLLGRELDCLIRMASFHAEAANSRSNSSSPISVWAIKTLH